ncbi:signal peptidase II [Patescibacteria group bacterium]|nr:signal peptidase II [Patescibacteria group bacterium]MBU1448957.1 signal peptidase II [Patescibacteria group bacterium]MBU2613325.1 signal peptidase II [Patescibacteria group bacterium]
MRAVALLLLLITGLVAADRYTKVFMMTYPTSGTSFSLGWLLEIVRHRNFGIVANIPIPWIVTVVVTVIVLGLIIVTSVCALKRNSLSEATALAFVMAGAIGNLWDRLQWHYVFDWILLFGRSAINLADIFIGVGLLWYVLGRRTSRPKIDLPTISS